MAEHFNRKADELLTGPSAHSKRGSTTSVESLRGVSPSVAMRTLLAPHG